MERQSIKKREGNNMMLLVGFGGAVGAALRYQIGASITKRSFETAFPYATFIVNMLGSFGLGILVSMHEQESISNWLWSLIGIGFFGAFTTYSTFSFEIIKLISDGKRVIGTFYLLLSVILGIIFVCIGMNIL